MSYEWVMETTLMALGSSPPLSFLSWILFGLVVGIMTAYLLQPEERRRPVLTCVAAVVGGVLGGWVITLFGVDAVGRGMWGSLLTGIAGAVLAAGVVTVAAGGVARTR